MIALLLLAAAQYQTHAVPPAMPNSGDALEAELSEAAHRLRTQCFSETAVKLLTEDTRQARASGSPYMAAVRTSDKELADAAFAEPFDANRMVQAMRARAKAQAESMEHYPDRSIALLQRLPKSDQARFARYLSGASPTIPSKTCS